MAFTRFQATGDIVAVMVSLGHEATARAVKSV
jgi:hypothetical protein